MRGKRAEPPNEERQPEAEPGRINRLATFLTRPRYFVIGIASVVFSGASIGLGIVYIPDPSSVRVLEDYTPSLQVVLYDDSGDVFGELEALERRELVAYQEIPEQLRLAFLDIEDARFFWHVGVDPIAVLGAVRQNITQGFGTRGASTITMQLSRDLWLTQDKTLSRKVIEAFYFALQTERYFSKERILELYMNQVFMGHNVYGFAAAADWYFGKTLDELTLPESAMLAGIVQRPNAYYPYRNPELALRRRDIVLGRMLTEGDIDRETFDIARNEPLVLADHDRSEELGAYFTEEIRKDLYTRYGTELYGSGLRVYTTLDPRIQAAAERALDKGLRDVDKRQGWRGAPRNLLDEEIDLAQHHDSRWDRQMAADDYVPAIVLEASPELARVRIADFTAELTPEKAAWTRRSRLDQIVRPGDLVSVRIIAVLEDGTMDVELDQEPTLQGAILVVENHTGEVKAMVGGHRFDNSEFNRARQAVRQTGSAFKPFVYATALRRGRTASDLMLDQPQRFMDPGTRQPYEPSNYHDEYVGITTTTEALAKSRNVVAVALQQEVGANNVIELARDLGITANLQPYLSLALGVVDVSLWEMTRAYAVFPNGGVRVEPHLVRTVVDREGRPLEVTERQALQVMNADVAYLTTQMLTNVIEYSYDRGLQGGSGRRARETARKIGMQLGGKTGTTDNFSDAWFLGFSPYHTIGVWLGNDTKKPIGPREEGARAALPIWRAVMEAASEGLKPREFELPIGVVQRTIDARTGLLSSDECGASVVAAYIEGTEPTEGCGEKEQRILALPWYQQAYFVDQIRERRVGRR